MRLQRKLTNKEWKEIGEKYKDGGLHMYRGKMTFFYNGEKIWEDDGRGLEGQPIVYDWEERDSCEVIIILPGVQIIPGNTFHRCDNVKTVIMSDSVRRIEYAAFYLCKSLEFVRLSRNLEYIGRMAFYYCQVLSSICIPPSCREIDDHAFFGCKKMIILGIHQNVQLGGGVFQDTILMIKSPVETDEGGIYLRSDDNEEEVVRWVKSINNEEAYALHRACSSYNPLPEIIHDLVKRNGIKAMRMPNLIGITPSQYLEANTFAEISERNLINRYILDMMGEVI